MICRAYIYATPRRALPVHPAGPRRALPGPRIRRGSRHSEAAAGGGGLGLPVDWSARHVAGSSCLPAAVWPQNS